MILRLVISNQRGGVAKTTTTTTLAWELAQLGMRVLIVDTDPQGSVSSVLKLKPQYCLKNFVIDQLRFSDCIVPAKTEGPGSIHVLCSNRETTMVETLLMAQIGREYVFQRLFSQVEGDFDAVLMDMSPSITLLQTCAMVYTQRIVIPVAMDMLSFQGANASIEAARILNEFLKLDIRVMGLLPVMVDRRLGVTGAILEGLEKMSAGLHIPLLPSVRTDQTVQKAFRAGLFLPDFDPRSKSAEDYRQVTGKLVEIMHPDGGYQGRNKSSESGIRNGVTITDAAGTEK